MQGNPFLAAKFVLLTALALAAGCVSASKQAAGPDLTLPSQVVLNWQGHPSTSMTISWRADDQEGPGRLRFSSDPARPLSSWSTRTAPASSFAESSATLFRVALTELEPDTTYHVVIEHPTAPEQFNFRTLPATRGARDLVFLAGGDSRSQRDVRRQVNALAAAQDPDFVIFDGDFIASALNETEWDEWFDDWHEQMIGTGGRRIPVIPAIGNHEVSGGTNQPRSKAPFYYNRFALPEPGSHHVLQLGPDLVLLTLDSGHTTSVESQTPWLDETLTAHADIPWKLVQYHVAAWPSVRDFDGAGPVKIRDLWVPLFEKHDVAVVIEAHDHAYKKTVPIRGGRRDDASGVIYTGDGGWGAPTRTVKDPADYWWLDEAASADHFWKFRLSADGEQLSADPIFLAEPAGTGFQLQSRLPVSVR